MTTGSIQEKNNKLYCVLNFKDESGKRIKKWIKTGLTAKGNKKRAELMLNEYLEKENEKAVSIPIENITTDNIQEQNIMFCDFIGEWLELQKSNIQTITYNNYYSIWQKHVYPYFKRLKSPLDKLQPIQVHKYYSDKMKSGLNPNTDNKT